MTSKIPLATHTANMQAMVDKHMKGVDNTIQLYYELNSEFI